MEGTLNHSPESTHKTCVHVITSVGTITVYSCVSELPNRQIIQGTIYLDNQRLNVLRKQCARVPLGIRPPFFFQIFRSGILKSY